MNFELITENDLVSMEQNETPSMTQEEIHYLET